MVRNAILVLSLLLGLAGCDDMLGDDDRANPIIRDGCHVGGCSSNVCSDDPGAVGTCEWRPEYACFWSATCERQRSGKCDWTPTAELNACISQETVRPDGRR